MDKISKRRVTREDWILAALDALTMRGLKGINIVHLAKAMKVTSGSFYWHFKNVRELQIALLEYWEVELTDVPIELTKIYAGNPKDRILLLMEKVISIEAARCDHAVSIWANTDPSAAQIFKSVMQKRFKYARWMFEQVGFSREEAKLRGRLMVAYLMGETTINLGSERSWKKQIAAAHNHLTK